MSNLQKSPIKEYKYWEIQLHANQSHIGRCVIWFKRDNVVDLFDITKEEREELWKIVNHLKEVLARLFKPNHFNYSSLSNVDPHLHVHIIPRYKDRVIFEDFEFIDERFGKNPYPYDKNFKIPKDIYNKIKGAIKNAL